MLTSSTGMALSMSFRPVCTAATVKAHGLHRVRVYVDDDLFPKPSAAYGWRTTYMPYEVPPVRALSVGRHYVWDTAIDAGQRFATRLANHGVSVRSVSRRLSAGVVAQ